MFEEADNIADVFRGSIPYYLFITLPILLICFSNPVLASSEFAVHRMSQFDVNGVAYGCRTSSLNLEAKSLYTWSTSRHCVVTRFQDMTIDQFQEIRAKAGGLIALLPKDISSLSNDAKQQLYLLEQSMISQESSIPIYFSQYNVELEKIIEDITRSSSNDYIKIQSNINNRNSNNSSINKRQSAFNELINTISANGYQIFVSSTSHSPNKQSKIPIIQGELAPIKNLKTSTVGGGGGDIDINNKLPLIMIVAHLDTIGLYNEYLLNSDVTVAFIIAELFSKLYNSISTAPRYRLMFLISESGPLINFQGVKKWLDENTQIQNIDFVLCLDTITQPISSKSIDSLYMHVSKPPKDNTPMNNFYKQLKLSALKYDNITIEGIHKKINLAESLLGWEHERFSMKRLPAFTLSSLRSHKDPLRTTIFKSDNHQNEIHLNTQKSAKILAEALARYIYDIPENDDGEIFTGAIDITSNLVRAWMDMKSILHNNDMKNAFEKYLKNVKIIYEKPDTREPDFMLYEGQDATLFVYRVKPAVFDLFLTLLIAAYLGCIYLVIIYFPQFYNFICKLSKEVPSSSTTSSSSSKTKLN